MHNSHYCTSSYETFRYHIVKYTFFRQHSKYEKATVAWNISTTGSQINCMHISLDNKNSIAVRRTVRICFALGGGMGVCSHLWGSSPPNAVLYSARWTSRGTLFISFSDVIIWPLAYRPSIGLHVFSCMLLCASRMASLVILALSLRAFIVLIAFFPRRLFVITVGLGGDYT